MLIGKHIDKVNLLLGYKELLIVENSLINKFFNYGWQTMRV